MASRGVERQGQRAQVEILHDPADDRRPHDAIRRRCRRRRDQLALALPPEDRLDRRPLSDWVLLAVYQALEEPPRPSRAELSHRRYHPTQLPLFTRAEVGGTSRDVPTSCRSFPSWSWPSGSPAARHWPGTCGSRKSAPCW